MLEKFIDSRVEVTVGDITQETTDAIVNAANWTLMGGGGIDGAIHAKGGKQILEECCRIRETVYPKGLPTGKAVITSSGNLKARFVIHTVGPIYGQNQGKDSALLSDCYTNCLQLAVENNLETISFPAISTGAFYYPKTKAAQVSSLAIKKFLSQNSSIKKVRLVFYSPADARTFIKIIIFNRRQII